jgi:hypothetical protein
LQSRLDLHVALVFVVDQLAECIDSDLEVLMLLPESLDDLGSHVVFLLKDLFLKFFFEILYALEEGFDFAGMHFIEGGNLGRSGGVTSSELFCLLLEGADLFF